MIEQDTVRLLRECDAGVKMGVSALEEVLPHVTDPALEEKLKNSKTDHEKLDGQLQRLLGQCRDEGKDPDPVAKGMSWLKTNAMLAMKDSDQTVADLITDGCNMGIKSLHKYLNQYKAASDAAKGITKDLIDLEQRLTLDVRMYL